MSRSLRVLILSTRYPSAARPAHGPYIEREALGLAARPGIEVQVVSPVALPPFPLSLRHRNEALKELPSREERNGLVVHRPRYPIHPYLPSLRSYFLTRRLLPAARALQSEFRPDVILAEFFWPEGSAAIRIARALALPVSIKARGMEFENKVRRRSTRRSVLNAGLAADGLLAVSAGLRDSMVRFGLPAERIQVHYNGIDHSLFHPRGRAEAKAALQIEQPLLLMVGNLIPEKAQTLAVEALALIDDAVLLVAGDGPERDRITRLAFALGLGGRVRLLGSVPNRLLPALYSAADVLIHPSRVEGFANVRLEAIACGTPVVTTDVGGAREIIDRPECGRIVRPDPGAIASAVREILPNPADPATISQTASRFSWARNAEQLEDHVRRLVASR